MTTPTRGKSQGKRGFARPIPTSPDETEVSVVYFSIAGRRYEICTTIEAREITSGPAQVIQLPKKPQ